MLLNVAGDAAGVIFMFAYTGLSLSLYGTVRTGMWYIPMLTWNKWNLKTSALMALTLLDLPMLQWKEGLSSMTCLSMVGQ